MRIREWSSDVGSSDLLAALIGEPPAGVPEEALKCTHPPAPSAALPVGDGTALLRRRPDLREAERRLAADTARIGIATADLYPRISLGGSGSFLRNQDVRGSNRSEEHTSELQSLMRLSYAVFCLKKKTNK